MSKFKIKDTKLPPLEATDIISTLHTDRTDAVIAWYNTAKENIDTAEILLNHARYPHTVFFIQQSIECIIKGIFSENGITEPQKATDINHYAFSAFLSYYTKYQDKYGVDFSNLVAEIVDKGKTFYDKLECCAAISNVLTNDYNNNIDVDNKVLSSKYDPVALGLDACASQIDCHKRIYKLFYFQYLLHLLSYVFSHEAESNARYPKFCSNGDVITPSSIYDVNISQNLSLLIILLKHIISEIINQSLNIMFWRCGTAAALS